MNEPTSTVERSRRRLVVASVLLGLLAVASGAVAIGLAVRGPCVVADRFTCLDDGLTHLSGTVKAVSPHGIDVVLITPSGDYTGYDYVTATIPTRGVDLSAYHPDQEVELVYDPADPRHHIGLLDQLVAKAVDGTGTQPTVLIAAGLAVLSGVAAVVLALGGRAWSARRAAAAA